MASIKLDKRRSPIRVLKNIFKQKIWKKDYKLYNLKLMGVKQNIFLFLQRMKRKNLRRWPKGKVTRRLKKRLIRSLRVKGRAKTILKLCKFERMLFKKEIYKNIIEESYKKYRKIVGISFLVMIKIRILCCLGNYLQYIIF